VEFQRDRARIIHSRTLEGWVRRRFLNVAGDHLRTRLTPFHRVASISRTIARALRLNEISPKDRSRTIWARALRALGKKCR
jgi:dGTPase